MVLDLILGDIEIDDYKQENEENLKHKNNLSYKRI
jgi:hypothetical protein